MVARILVAVGVCRSSDVAIADGLKLARALNAPVTFLHVVTAFDLPIIDAPAGAHLTPVELQAGLDAAAAAALGHAKAQSRARGIAASFAVRGGISITRSIAAFASEQGFDLIIAGSGHRSKWHRLFASPIATRLAEISDIPVWVSSHRPWRSVDEVAPRSG